jgi:hypothetical protein
MKRGRRRPRRRAVLPLMLTTPSASSSDSSFVPDGHGDAAKKRAVCINYSVVQGRQKQHAPNMESTFPAIFFAAIIGVIVFIAVSQVLLDPHE